MTDMGSKWYKVTLSPLEFYHLGNEHSFRRSKDTYFAESDQIPTQTTIFGMVRYYMLKCANLLGFDEQNKVKREQLIGEKSFSYDDKNQDFGKLKKITSLQIVSQDGKKVYIKRPYNLMRDEKGFVIKKEKYKTYELVNSEEQYHYNDFKGKFNSGGGDYLELNLDSKNIKTVQEDLFAKTIKPHVNKVERLKKGKKSDGAFFKVEMYQLKPEFAFQFFLEVDDDVDLGNEDVVFLGSYKSAFTIRLEEIDNDKNVSLDFTANIKEILEKNLSVTSPFYYALSDVCLTDMNAYKFSVNSKRQVRNLITAADAKCFNKPEDLRLLYGRGSVFYASNDKFAMHENAKQIGLNQLIEINGEMNNGNEQ